MFFSKALFLVGSASGFLGDNDVDTVYHLFNALMSLFSSRG